MNAKSTVLLLLLCSISFLFCGTVSAIEGGVVYSYEGDVIYQEIETGRTINLTSDLNVRIDSPIAISEDGEILVWLQNNRFFGRVLPDGEPFALPTSESLNDKELIKRLTERWGKNRLKATLERLSKIPGEIRGTLIDIVISSRKNFIVYVTERSSSTRLRIAPVRIVNRDRRGDHIGFYPLVSESNYISPAWSKEKEIVAYIQRQSRKVGPIKQWDCTTYLGGMMVWEKPTPKQKERIKKGPFEDRESETHVSLPADTFGGLAFRPDGTLTLISNRTIYSDTGEVIFEDIRGANLHWTTNHSFIFRGDDGALYGWENNQGRKLLPAVPESFSYCSRSPFAEINKKRIFTGTEFFIGTIRAQWSSACYFNPETKEIPEQLVLIETRMRGQEPLQFAFSDETDIEEIQDPSVYDYRFAPPLSSPVNSQHIWGGFWVDPRTRPDWKETFEGTKTGERILRDYEAKIKAEIRTKTLLRRQTPRVALNEIIILKLNNRYAAIKPLELQFNPERRFAPTLAYDEEGNRLGTLTIPTIEYLVFEWRYWPSR